MLKPVDPKHVFSPSCAKSPFKGTINPTKIRNVSLDRIAEIADAGDLAKAEVVRYCIEFALLNADWFDVTHMKRVFKEGL